ncbi:MAG: long-chain fatty acid--CoA ligase [Bacteroidales bacterium]|nr:long-chain fatty acid--CoA ligase [Bacteroidales bacterium]
MDKKANKGKTIQAYPDIPPRTFDLLPRFVEKYGKKKVMFASKVDGAWKKYISRDFVKMTDVISQGLIGLGVGKGDRVVVVSNNCPQWNMVDFAVQQIGAILVPIYPTARQSDYEHILNHAEPKVVFEEGALIHKKVKLVLDQMSVRPKEFAFNPVEGMMTLRGLMVSVKIDKKSQAALQSRKESVSIHDVATIIYTSGTLGTPKGVMLTHYNLMSCVANYGPHYPVPSSHKVVSFLPLSHIYERSVLYTHLYLGNSTYYVENFGTIMRDIADVKPEHFTTVPRVIEKVYNGIVRKGDKLKGMKKRVFMWAFKLAERYDETGIKKNRTYRFKLYWANRLVFRDVRKAFGGRLEFIISGGASLQPRLVRLFAAMDIPIIEGYGLTETSPVIATNSLALGIIKAGTVGVPCDSVTFKIDPESGEILVKGSAVMKGYYKDEEQTKIAIDEEGYFHTGDIGEFDEDGLLKITGRMKEIFKDSMGKYISPALIENRFMESKFINSIMVVGENQKFAAALIVPNFEHLKTWCEENHIPYTTNAEMIKVKAVNDRFRKEVDNYNKFFGDYEKIKRFELLDREWTIEDGEMTPSLKIRRKAIAEHFQGLIDGMFAE